MSDTRRLLAIDTLSAQCSVASCHTDEPMVLHRGTGTRRHAGEVLSLVTTVCEEAGHVIDSIDCIAVIIGPGSFTGLRIGTSVAQGLGFTTGAAIRPVSSLALLAYAGFLDSDETLTRCQTVLAARPGEFYHARYRIIDGVPVLTGTEQAGALPDPDPDWPLITDAVTRQQILTVTGSESDSSAMRVVEVDAAILAGLAMRLPVDGDSRLCAPADAVPVYIKDDLEYRMSGPVGQS